VKCGRGRNPRPTRFIEMTTTVLPAAVGEAGLADPCPTLCVNPIVHITTVLALCGIPASCLSFPVIVVIPQVLISIQHLPPPFTQLEISLYVLILKLMFRISPLQCLIFHLQIRVIPLAIRYFKKCMDCRPCILC
jgi:hypothetical protein